MPADAGALTSVERRRLLEALKVSGFTGIAAELLLPMCAAVVISRRPANSCKGESVPVHWGGGGLEGIVEYYRVPATAKHRTVEMKLRAMRVGGVALGRQAGAPKAALPSITLAIEQWARAVKVDLSYGEAREIVNKLSLTTATGAEAPVAVHVSRQGGGEGGREFVCISTPPVVTVDSADEPNLPTRPRPPPRAAVASLAATGGAAAGAQLTVTQQGGALEATQLLAGSLSPEAVRQRISTLQPYVMEAATLGGGGCNHM